MSINKSGMQEIRKILKSRISLVILFVNHQNKNNTNEKSKNQNKVKITFLSFDSKKFFGRRDKNGNKN